MSESLTPRTRVKKIQSDPEDLQAQYYTRTASAYDEMHVEPDDEHYLALSHISHFVSDLKVETILDVGCGTGRGIKYFLEKHPALKVRGIEPVDALIQAAIVQNGIPPELIDRGNGLDLPYESHSFDAVCEFGVLHHVPDPDAVVGEMIRVAKKAIFLSDYNRFGQGRWIVRLLKLLLYKTGSWGIANHIKTGGKGYTITEGDGLGYSYSPYDSFDQLARWADRLILIPTSRQKANSWCHPLLTSSHVLLCAVKESTS
jgi:ubiquinone/menaquinone biosynthesis C-methylase UbiE